MFERFTEPARRLLFFARYETSATGALSIESEHMLLGLLREPGPIVGRLLAGTQRSVEQLREEIESRIEFREKVATSVEIPFSEQTKRILSYTALEADGLGHSEIGPEHVLLALLRVPEAGAGAILAGHGLRLEAAREVVATMVDEPPPPSSRRATSGRDTAAPQADTADIVAHIERIQRLVSELSLARNRPQEAGDLLHVLTVELSALRSRFS